MSVRDEPSDLAQDFHEEDKHGNGKCVLTEVKIGASAQTSEALYLPCPVV